MHEQSRIYEKYEQELNTILSGEASFSSTSRALYSTAACMYKIKPAGVVYPKSASDVVETVKFARQAGLSVTARGAGSSLAGQVLNEGVILDFSKHMGNILKYDSVNETVVVQPGVVYGDLNRYLKEFNRYFPPDPSSGEYCTVGGMVANNAGGSHSVKNGFTIDYLESIKIVTHDARILELNEHVLDSPEFENLLKEDVFSEQVLSSIKKHKLLIDEHTPKVKKNSSGYRLEKVVREGIFNLARLFCGSEGTLGIITEITFRVKKPPLHKNLTIINFRRLEDAAQSIQPILKLNPSAVEMMEKKAMHFVKKYRPDLEQFYPEGIESQLYVEFDGPVKEETEYQNHQLTEYLNNAFPADRISFQVAEDAKQMAELWKIRKASFPLVYLEKRPEKVPAFIEDFVVPPEKIANFIEHLYALYQEYNIDAMILGHAGNGNFHTRPFINFRKESDLKLMHKLAAEITDKVIELGGAISGEHGDGRARAHLLRQQAGPLFEVYEEIKQLFDPDGVLNPDVKISRKNQLTENLRFNPDYQRLEVDTLLHFEEDDYFYEIEKCHGCGACRQSNATTTMCPLFQISGDELAAPRGKTDILQKLISGDLDSEFMDQTDFKKMLDYCVYCEGCFVECPSHVDVGRLLLEHKARYRAEHGAPVLQRVLEYSESMSKMQTWFAPLANPIMGLKLSRYLLEKTVGIDRRRTLPKANSIIKFNKHNRTETVQKPVDKVLLFHDMYARFNDSSLTALAIGILNKLEIEVASTPLASAAMPATVYGNIKLARKIISKSVPKMTAYIQEGYKIISTEPTAVLALCKEWKDIYPGREVELISQNTFEFFDYLLKMSNDRKICLDLNEVKQDFGYHAPCHLKALSVGRPGVTLLRKIPGVKINEIEAGCCGIAGTYGFKKGENGYEQSMKIGAGLFAELKKSENQLGLSECSTCRIQMEHGSGKRAIHPVQVLAQAMNVVVH